MKKIVGKNNLRIYCKCIKIELKLELKFKFILNNICVVWYCVKIKKNL